MAYAIQAKRLAERTGRTDVCALPYGINTVSLFAHVFLVMLPAKALATAAGAADPARIAWQAGLFATFASGVIELAAAPVAERLRRITPRAALLSTLAGIALSFISLGFLFRTFARPVVGLTTLAIVMLTYFGRVQVQGAHPRRRARGRGWHGARVAHRDRAGRARRRRARRCICRSRSSATSSPRSPAATSGRTCR